MADLPQSNTSLSRILSHLALLSVFELHRLRVPFITMNAPYATCAECSAERPDQPTAPWRNETRHLSVTDTLSATDDCSVPWALELSYPHPQVEPPPSGSDLEPYCRVQAWIAISVLELSGRNQVHPWIDEECCSVTINPAPVNVTQLARRVQSVAILRPPPATIHTSSYTSNP